MKWAECVVGCGRSGVQASGEGVGRRSEMAGDQPGTLHFWWWPTSTFLHFGADRADSGVRNFQWKWIYLYIFHISGSGNDDDGLQDDPRSLEMIHNGLAHANWSCSHVSGSAHLSSSPLSLRRLFRVSPVTHYRPGSDDATMAGPLTLPGPSLDLGFRHQIGAWYESNPSRNLATLWTWAEIPTCEMVAWKQVCRAEWQRAVGLCACVREKPISDDLRPGPRPQSIPCPCVSIVVCRSVIGRRRPLFVLHHLALDSTIHKHGPHPAT